jgi:hypothetical protein
MIHGLPNKPTVTVTDGSKKMQRGERGGGENRGGGPQELVKGWKKIFHTSTWIAQYMVDRLVSSIEEYGRTEIWKIDAMQLLHGRRQSTSQPGARRSDLLLETTISTH